MCRESVSSEAIRLPSEFREASEDIGDSVSDWLCILEGFQGRIWGWEVWEVGQTGKYIELCGDEF